MYWLAARKRVSNSAGVNIDGGALTQSEFELKATATLEATGAQFGLHIVGEYLYSGEDRIREDGTSFRSGSAQGQ